VGLWYGSKETREESDSDIWRSQSVRIVGQWDALVLHLFKKFLKGCTFVACGIVLEKKVTLTFVGVSKCRLWVNGIL
jgi:hypothetical protein